MPNQSLETGRDEDLAHEIQTKLSQTTAHPKAIRVAVENGIVTLSGPVPEREVDKVLTTVRFTPGVKGIRDQLATLRTYVSDRTTPKNLYETQYVYESQFLQASWPPSLRVAAGATGILSLALGLNNKGLSRVVLGALGIGALLRAATNRELTPLLGMILRPVIRLHRNILVSMPVEAVFDFWRRFENYPFFMSYVREVEVDDQGGLRWVIQGPASSRIEWHASLEKLVHNQVVHWKSIPGSPLSTEGVIQFHPAFDNSTCVDIWLSYAPPAGALGLAAASILGFDPRSRIDEDLLVMKTLIEEQL